MNRRTFTSESVTEGHPDKVADQISDAVLDAALTDDPHSRVACETIVTANLAVIAGEITTTSDLDLEAIARNVIVEIGYSEPELRFDGHTCDIRIAVQEQSADIAMGVDDSREVRGAMMAGTDELDRQGAGDQGFMFGYATEDTDTFMPMPIHLAHRLAEQLAAVRHSGSASFIRPDGKTQVTFELDDSGTPRRLETVLVSTQHEPDAGDSELRAAVIDQVIAPTVPDRFADDGYEILVNPTGRFVLGGPAGDTGLTGRKLMVDTYGGMARHGGGAFSGKDPTKVDRSGAYAVRWVAKNLVAAGAAQRCEVQVAYAIGVARPVSLFLETFGTERVDPAKLATAVNEVFDLRPAAILRDLDLRRPIYRPTATYGHFGRTGAGFTWERTDRVEELQSILGL